MNEPGFWEQAPHSPILDRYRELDVLVRSEERYAEQIEELRRALDTDRGSTRDAERLARGLDQARAALTRWDQQLADEGPSRVWLLIVPVDSRRSVADWLESVAAMEERWCRRRGHEIALVACEQGRSGTQRLVFFVEGPGAAADLAMEQGVHRLQRSTGADPRVEVRVIPATIGGEAYDQGERVFGVEACRHQEGPFCAVFTCRAQLLDHERGIAWRLLGRDPATLEHLIGDLAAALREPREDRVVARLYGGERGTVRDPRTNVTVARARAVLDGELEIFLEAFRERFPLAHHGASARVAITAK
jgi:protein subunit release factor A